MPYIETNVVLEAKRIDLLTYLQNYEPQELVKLSSDVYTTRTHDSLKISNGKWMWWSQGIGGKSALDYLIKVKGLSFLEAVEVITGKTTVKSPVYTQPKTPTPKNLLLPNKCISNDKVIKYLCGRGIDKDIVNHCIKHGIIYESLPYHNVVFVGFDEKNNPKHASYRATRNVRIMGDCCGSDKHYSFRMINGKSNEIHLFESAIDLLSFATLEKRNGKNYLEYNLLSLDGIYQPKKSIENSAIPVSLARLLKNNTNIKRIIIHFDNDIAGKKATEMLKNIISKNYEVVDSPPPFGKDFNDFLLSKKEFIKTNNLKGSKNYER